MRRSNRSSVVRRFIDAIQVGAGAVGLTTAFFLVLPLIQVISKTPTLDTELRAADTANLPPPPPPPEQEPEKPPEADEEPPKLMEDAAPLELSQLELVLNPGAGGGWMGGDFAVRLNTMAGSGDGAEALFSLADLDQKPRPIYQPSPALDSEARRHTPGTVYVLFIVDQRGKVESPIVQRASDPIFEAPALAAVRNWKFEPGKRNGKAVRFRMRVPITFPQG